MGIKEKLSGVWQKLKNRFNGQNASENMSVSEQELAEAPAVETVPEEMSAYVPMAELVETEESSEAVVSRNQENPETGEPPIEEVLIGDAPVAPISSRMTDEYKEWLMQQREAADAENNTTLE